MSVQSKTISISTCAIHVNSDNENHMQMSGHGDNYMRLRTACWIGRYINVLLFIILYFLIKNYYSSSY